MVSHFDRRQFLSCMGVGVTAASQVAAGTELGPQSESSPAESDGSSNQIAILNDTHIGENHGPGHTHAENLSRAVQTLIGIKDRLAGVIINGDLAMSVGTPGDYSRFKTLIEPLQETGVPLHLTLGNHDNRDEFLRAFPEVRSATQFNDHRHNGIVELPQARLLLLDSLRDTPAAPGLLGQDQTAWLLQEIDAVPDKPVIVVAHHNPQTGGDPIHFPGGIVDTDAFWPELVQRPHVKAFVHGHVHNWTLAMHSGIHIINTLASAMVADKAVSTNGWTLAAFHPHGVSLEIHSYDPNHPWNRERKWLYWRRPK